MFYRSLFQKLPLFAGALLASVLGTNSRCDENNNNVFIWGNGYYQARPDAIMQFQNFIPKKVVNLPKKLVKLQFGQYYEGGIDADSNLFIWQSRKIDANLQDGQVDNTRQGIKLLAKNVKEVKFTTGYIWILTLNGQVIQFPIIKEFNSNKQVKLPPKIGKERKVQPLKDSVQIDAGNDHFIALKKNGEVYAMGDDTYGQCGQAEQGRNTHPPFTQKRISYPVKVQYLKNIKRIASGADHCLALDDQGNLFGWGSNSSMQLSHQQEFSKMNAPLLCSYNPIKISKNLDNCEILDIKAGEQFSIIIGKNRASESFEVYTFGNNLKGQLGLGQIRHLRDITRVEGLSNYILKVKGKKENVLVSQLSCGRKHCIALLNIGYIMEWGDNEYGQMGNKKRSPVHSPLIIRQFSQKNIIGVFANENNSGVIINEPQSENK